MRVAHIYHAVEFYYPSLDLKSADTNDIADKYSTAAQDYAVWALGLPRPHNI